ncbi:MAG: hypothetical protein EHM70_22600 [Chloroflexota bacterium]|nr:MAG: hypothetical protein EHM70_22600 [Chloroflexota bacterium]
MATLSGTTLINKPVDMVFSFITNAENHKAWQPMLKEAKVTPPGPIGVGSTYIYTTEVMGRRIETKMQVSRFEQNCLWAFKTIGVPQPVETVYAFQPEANATRLTITMEVPAGAYPAAAEAMIKQQMQKSLEDQGKQLKSILEK